MLTPTTYRIFILLVKEEVPICVLFALSSLGNKEQGMAIGKCSPSKHQCTMIQEFVD